jgi:hypothetical protein
MQMSVLLQNQIHTAEHPKAAVRCSYHMNGVTQILQTVLIIDGTQLKNVARQKQLPQNYGNISDMTS